eukprot:15431442-Alexandrium_andersonii.AAC.1
MLQKEPLVALRWPAPPVERPVSKPLPGLLCAPRQPESEVGLPAQSRAGRPGASNGQSKQRRESRG